MISQSLFYSKISSCLCYSAWIIITGIGIAQAAQLSYQQNYKYSTYHKSIICNASYPPASPESLSDIQQIIRFALAQQITVKPVGSRHSATDVICTDGLPIYMDKIRQFSYDPNSEVVTIGGGATLKLLTDELHRRGRALAGMAIFQGITIGGSIGTGAHGSSLVTPSTLSDQMVGLTVVDGLGQVRNISGGDLLRAFRTHLGLLGIVYEVRIRTVPQYKIQVRHQLISDKVMLDSPEEIIGLVRSHRFSSVWWFPSSSEVIVSKGDAVGTETPGDCQIHYLPEFTPESAQSIKDLMYQLQDRRFRLGMFIMQNAIIYSLLSPLVGRDPIYTSTSEGGVPCTSPYTGWSHQMLSYMCQGCLWDMEPDPLQADESEVYFPVSEFGGAVQSIRRILEEHPTDFELNGIYFRFVTQSDGILSMNRGSGGGSGGWVAVEWPAFTTQQRFSKARFGLAPKQAMIQALVEKHQGRAHWGKNGLAFTSPELILLQNGLESLTQFREYMEELDPHGLFLNDFGRRLKLGERKMTLDAERAEHCAVSEHCFCSRNWDCGANVEARCNLLQGYPVCTQEWSQWDKDRFQTEHKIIKTLKPVFQQIFRFLNIFN